MVNVTIDYREHKLIECCNIHEYEYKCENLQVGDIIVSHEDCTIIIERKTMNDLSASIIDGRYHEQQNRLLETKCIIIYIIEGTKTNDKGVSYKSCQSALLTMQSRHNIIVVRSKDIDDTLQYLKLISQKLEKKEFFVSKNEYVNVNVRKSSNNDVYLNMLCCIPGISTNIAQKIKNKYPTFNMLYDQLKENDNAILNIEKIGPRLVTNIKSSLNIL